jgi:hypothetical protein
MILEEIATKDQITMAVIGVLMIVETLEAEAMGEAIVAEAGNNEIIAKVDN